MPVHESGAYRQQGQRKPALAGPREVQAVETRSQYLPEAQLLTLGSLSEVDEYCHRLIEEVGRVGGFILGSGCEQAPNARPENVKAMLESVVKYGYY